VPERNLGLSFRSDSRDYTTYKYRVEIKRKLRKVGNSVMLAMPPETLAESGFEEGQLMRIRSQRGRIEVEPDVDVVPDAEIVAFAARFTDRYREALSRLAEL